MAIVKAALSFGPYTRGRRYELDASLPAVSGLIAAGYFLVEEEDCDDVAVAGGPWADWFPDVGVVDGVSGLAEGSLDGQGGSGHAGGSADGA